VAGNPREWFNVLEEQQYRARWRMDHASDLSHAAYLRIAKEESTTSNGISGVKLHYYQLAELRAKVEAMENIPGLTFAKSVSIVFPQAKYLWLRRRDKARQAISLYIAYSTDKWWAIAGAASDKREGATGDPEFAPHAIARM
jgi:LPS sulfotransferase NodH